MKRKNFKIRSEIDNKVFDELSDDWWNENGAFKALHSFNLVRLKYIKTNIDTNSLKNLRILDIGCGGGILCEPLSRLGAKVTGIDTNSKAIQVAKNHAKQKGLIINYQNVDVGKIKLNNFDIITCMEVLEHANDINYIISESKKILKNNGIFIGSTINKTFSSYIFAIFFAENIFKIVPKGTHQWDKLIKPNFLKKLFLQNKFSQFETQGVAYNPINNLWSYSKSEYINYLFFAKNS